jgi:hypothetical protein
MRVALFAYPARLHIHLTLGNRKGEYYENLARALQARFRSNGYDVVWLLSCTREDRTKPDLENLVLDSIDDAQPVDDAILVSPLGLHEVWGHRISDEVVTSLIDQLGHVEDLAVCGFHDRSVVEQLAAAACQSDNVGSVTIHEDLTEYGLTDAILKQTAEHPEQRVNPFLLDMEANRPNERALARIYNAEYRFRCSRPYREQIPTLEEYLGQMRSQMVAVA